MPRAGYGRDKNGKFLKGSHHSLKTEFKKGQKSLTKVLIPKERLKILYYKDKKGYKEISNIFNVCVLTIQSRMKEYNFVGRNNKIKKGQLKGKKWDILYGKEKALKLKKGLSESHKGEKNPMYGKEQWNKNIPCRESTKRILSEKLKGRKLKNQIVVHHINGNHNDNRPENRIRITRSEHARLHARQGDITGRPKAIRSDIKW